MKKNKPPAPIPEISREPPPNTYSDQREKLSKNNIDKEQMMELATPLTENHGYACPAHPAAGYA